MTPTPSSPLDALIAELERAKEGSRKLDRAIADHVGTSVLVEHEREGSKEWVEFPFYTTSLDAALTLVPEGWEWQLRATGASLTTYSRDPSEYRKEHADGATAPLALVIAALKARAKESPAAVDTLKSPDQTHGI